MLFIEASSDPNAVLDQQSEDDAFYAATLKEMVAMGLEIGRIIHQQVVAQAIDSPHSPIDDQSSVSYDRIFRAVRRGILLAKRLSQPEPPRKHANTRRKIIRDVGEAIRSQAKTPKDAENLYADLRDRLDSPDFEEDLENRPIPDLINEIRKDLGLAPMSPAALSDRAGVREQEKPSPACGTGLNEGAATTTGDDAETVTPTPPPSCGTTTQPHPKQPGPPYPPGS